MTGNVKKELYEQCKAIAKAKVDTVREAMEMAQESANSETRNTTGDKHDTSRAMMQLEVEQQSKQLAEVEKLQTVLVRFTPQSGKDKVALGSLVVTDAGNYYVSISVGKLTVGKDVFFAISSVSPIAGLMMGKKKGEKFDFNGKTIKIKDVL